MNYLSVMESFYTFMHPIERIFDHMWLVLLTSTRVLGSNMNRDVPYRSQSNKIACFTFHIWEITSYCKKSDKKCILWAFFHQVTNYHITNCAFFVCFIIYLLFLKLFCEIFVSICSLTSLTVQHQGRPKTSQCIPSPMIQATYHTQCLSIDVLEGRLGSYDI